MGILSFFMTLFTRRTHGKMHQVRVFILCCFLCFTLHSALYAAEETTYKVEAVFLYNFFNYITWPGMHSPEDLKQATICINADDPIDPYLEYIQHKGTSERMLNIRSIDPESSLSGCQIFFIRNANIEEINQLRPLANQNNVLLVSTMPNFINNGGMIGLSPEGDRMAIEIDNTQLKQANFQVSSRLLNLARKVK